MRRSNCFTHAYRIRCRTNSIYYFYGFKFCLRIFAGCVIFYKLRKKIIVFMGKFEVSKRKNEEFQFNLKATNGQIILSSEGYTTKAACMNGIESVKKNSQDESKFDVLESKNGKHYFNLKATNGQIIGSSQMYESLAGCQNGVQSVMKNAPEAEIVEEL